MEAAPLAPSFPAASTRRRSQHMWLGRSRQTSKCSLGYCSTDSRQRRDACAPPSLSPPRHGESWGPPLFQKSSRKNLKNTSIWDVFCLPSLPPPPPRLSLSMSAYLKEVLVWFCFKEYSCPSCSLSIWSHHCQEQANLKAKGFSGLLLAWLIDLSISLPQLESARSRLAGSVWSLVLRLQDWVLGSRVFILRFPVLTVVRGGVIWTVW